MNHPALDEALQDLADGPSNVASIRATVAHRVDARRRQRRSVALVAVAAAVAVIVGGIGVVAASQRSAPIATQPDRQHQTSDVIPGGSKLVPYVAPPLISPVTVTAGGPPVGYVASRVTDVSSLEVTWPDADYLSPDSDGPVGYQIDQAPAFGSLRTAGGNDPTKEMVSTQPITINGHAAEFNRAPDGTKEVWTMPGTGTSARIWITWKLTDGSYIHVWTSADNRTKLLRLANGIIEKPSTLDSYISLGLTLPGLTVRGTSGIREPTNYASSPLDESIYLCPLGTASVQLLRSNDEHRTCLSAWISPTDAAAPAGQIVEFNGLPVHVVAAPRMAWVDLGRGYSARVAGPADMSTADLVRAVTSIRLDPQVAAAPPQPIETPAVNSAEMSAPQPATPTSSPATPSG